MNFTVNVIALCIGASLGALSRWGVSFRLNTKALSFSTLPLGTLVVNWMGAWILGIFFAIFSCFPQTSPLWRLAIVTGFLGALTTFSTFSGEVVVMLFEGRYFWAVACACLHLFGSLILVLFGMQCAKGVLWLFS